MKNGRMVNQSPDDYHLIFANMSDGSAVAQIVFDAQGKPVDLIILEFNKAFENYSSFKGEHAAGKSISAFLPKAGQEWYEKCGAAARTGGMVQFEMYHELMDRRFQIQAIPLRHDDKIGILITQMKEEKKHVKADDEPAQSTKDKYETILNTIDDGFCTIDVIFDNAGKAVDWRYLKTNPQFANQGGMPGAAGKLASELYPMPETWWFELFGNVALSGAPKRMEKEIKSTNKWFDISAFKIGGPESRKLGVLHRDITDRKRAEEALRESEMKFRAVIEMAGEGIAIARPNGTMLYINRRMADMLGYSQEEILGRSDLDFCCDERKPHVLNIYRDLHAGNAVSSELMYKRKDGSVLLTMYNASPIINGKGEHVAIFAMHTDITERKRLEQQQALLSEISKELMGPNTAQDTMERLGEKIGRYFGAAWCMFLAVGLDFDNASASYGWNDQDAPSLKGTYRMRDFLTDEKWARDYFGNLMVVGDTQTDPRVNAKMCKSLNILSIIVVPINLFGQWRYQLSIIDNKPRKWRDDEVSMLKEIADRYRTCLERDRAAEALLKSEVLLQEELAGTRLLQRISTEMLLEFNDQEIYGKLLDASTEIMQSDCASIQMLSSKVGTQPELYLLLSRGFCDEAAKFWKWIGVSAATASGEALRTGLRIVLPDIENCDYLKGTEEREVYLKNGIHSCQSTPLMTRNGIIVGMISTHWLKPHEPEERQLRLFDVLARQAADFIERRKGEEELKESEQRAIALVAELEKADKNKNEFIGVLSHELRNPLATIAAGLSLLEVSDDREQKENTMAIIRRQSKQLCKLVDDLLDLTRITQQKIKLKKETVDLREILKNAVEDLKPGFRKKGLKLVIRVYAEPVLLSADPVRITQCIGNILYNALKFTQENGTVWISLQKAAKNAVIRVRDNGIGISEETLAQLFKPFVQADHSLHRHENEGLGLGLSIVKGIIEMHGGMVAASSAGLGKGSLFTIKLPLKQENDDLPDPAARDTLKRVYKILTIEDNKDLTGLMCSIFHMLGHEALAAYDGMEGLKKIREAKPDIVFCDIGLPLLSGYEVAKAIRGDDAFKHIRLIALTGYAGDSDLEMARKCGFDLLLAKPADIAAIKKLLSEIQ